jgi:trimethylamine--corrinoid protein Co-methyltransferase
VSKKIKAISNPRLSLNILSPEDIKKIHNASLSIIESVGIRFRSNRALDIWEAHGAKVDRNTSIVKVPGHIMEQALKTAPPVYTLSARDPSQDLQLDGNHVYVATDGCGVQMLDINTGKRRSSTLQDIADIALVADALEEVAYHWVPVSAQDCPPESRSLHELRTIWANSTKHLQTESIYSAREAEAAVEMAAIMAGGRDALRKRPMLSFLECTMPPLGQDEGSVEAALVAAEAGLPVGFMTMSSCVSTGPATLAGNLAVGNAEVISDLALIQLAFPGAPVYYSAAQTVMDLRTGGYTGGGPEDFLFGAAGNVLANYYNVPLSMGSFGTGAKLPDWQAGVENSFATFMSCISMSDMLLGAGLLHGSRVWSFEDLLMDCEIFDIIYYMMKGIVVDDESLALDTIRSVGPGGNFLSQKHTKKHLHELWVPSYMDRRPYDVWEEKQDGARDWARENAKQILATHQPDPLDPKIVVELKRIAESLETK